MSRTDKAIMLLHLPYRNKEQIGVTCCVCVDKCFAIVALCTVDVKAYSANNVGERRDGYVKLNGVPVWQASWDGPFPNLRGVNTVLIDPYSCSAKGSGRFDTLHSEGNAVLLRDYLNRLKKGTFVVGVTADEATRGLTPALDTLNQFGVDVSDVSYRGAFAFIAQKGFASKTVLRKALTQADAFANQPRFSVVIRGILYTVYTVLHLIR